jgi:hypothetical protein
MAVTKIDDESKWRSRLRIDIDKHRYTYQTSDFDDDYDVPVTINFVSPALYVYENYKFFLLKNSVVKKLETKFYNRPDYLAYEEYGTTVLWTMILYINDIPNIESFMDIKELYIPTMGSIYKVANDTIHSQSINISEVIKLSNKIHAKAYTKKSSPTLVDQPRDTEVNTEDDFYFMRQLFEIKPINATNQFIDLSFIPIAQSLSFRIKDKSEFIYDVDYTITTDDHGKSKRIIWDRRYVDGDGLIDVIDNGMLLEIQYSRKL